ncbi:hypothetical protein GUJ93_ZPchr1152g33317 [Zizania palustris]|uniref:Uncharacterized protein n=1 Tax=Zizania palustris TaxID=103762 RepID=A0A8J5RAV9_ZIZPA|nr:hypothetical protein GUJ93_ZPchr1152g33317 [Zizania palustris]
MQVRVASMEDVKEARQSAAAGAQGRVFPTGMLKVFLGFLLLGVALSAVGMYMARHTLAAAAPALFRPCLGAWGSAAEEEPEGLERWTRPPDRVEHAMTDEELLWRASFAPRVRQYPFRRVPKMAFMFLTRGPLPLAPLWERFFRGHEDRYSIYIHALPSYRANFTSDSVFYRRQIPSKVAEWGQMTMCDAERRFWQTLCWIYPMSASTSSTSYGKKNRHWVASKCTNSHGSAQGKLVDTIRRPITAASAFHQSAAKHLQPLVTLARTNGISRRGLLTITILTSTAAIPEASDQEGLCCKST